MSATRRKGDAVNGCVGGTASFRGSGDCPDRLHDKSFLTLAPERLIMGRLNTQSPSERWNGDCPLSQDETNRFDEVHSVSNAPSVTGQSPLPGHCLLASFAVSPTPPYSLTCPWPIT